MKIKNSYWCVSYPKLDLGLKGGDLCYLSKDPVVKGEL